MMKSFEDIIFRQYHTTTGKDRRPQCLYHYTSIDGLMGISKLRKIWASNIKYLNDKDEFVHTLNLLEKKCKKKFKGRSKDKLTKTFYDIFKGSDLVEDFDIYTFSLTEEGDLLSQWRGYCPNYGFSIGFDFSKLNRLIKKNNLENCFLLPCFYKNQSKEYFIDLIIDEAFESISESIKLSDKTSNKENFFRDVLKTYSKKVIIVSSIFKSDSFFEESEWRLFHFRRSKDNIKDIKYRNGRSLIIPYLELEIEDKYKSTPLKEVIIGPSPHLEPSKKSANMLLKSNNFECKVSESKIPFRKL